MKQTTTIGIQGYKGSFNEQACLLYCKDHAVENPKIEYLYTTDKVLQQLGNGHIRYGIFALTNSYAGVMLESVEAMSAYVFSVLDVFEMPVEFVLLGKKGATLKKIERIMSHTSILESLQEYLQKTFPKKELINGEGVLADQAAVAAHLAEPGSPDNLAVIAPASCAEFYGLDIISSDLPHGGMTTFLWCQKRTTNSS